MDRDKLVELAERCDSMALATATRALFDEHGVPSVCIGSNVAFAANLFTVAAALRSHAPK